MNGWNDELKRHYDLEWKRLIMEVEKANMHAALSGTHAGIISPTYNESVRRANKEGSEETSSTPLQPEIQRQGNNDYHGASKAKSPNTRRIGDTIIRKKDTHKQTVELL